MALDQMLRLRPVVAFDMDGVIRVRKMEGLEDELIPREITLLRDEYPEIFHGQPRWEEDGTRTSIEYFSVAGVDYLRSIAYEGSIADPVWASTWQRWANYYFARALDLPDLPVAVETLEPDELNYAHCSPDWKTNQLARNFDGRPLVWIDDNMPDRPGEDLTQRRRPVDRAITLSYKVNPWTGITPEDVEAISSWVQTASHPTGQGYLREKRAEALRRDRARWAKDERRRSREREIFKRTLERASELFPGQDYLNRQLAAISKSPYGLTAESVGYALKRASVNADAEALSAKLRVPRFHREFLPADDAVGLDF